MSTQLTAAGDSEPRPTPNSGGGLFSLYKSGQGYWTRLGTALAAGAIILFVAWFVFNESAVFTALQDKRSYRFGLAAGVAAVLAFVVWWVMNAPRRGQFLIDTDGEMKKVNWASWPELIGSTRIVIAFMLLTALTLFVFDTQFHAFFYAITIWHIKFDAWMGVITGTLLSTVLLGISVGLLRSPEPTKASKIAGTASLIAGVAIATAWAIFAKRTGMNF